MHTQASLFQDLQRMVVKRTETVLIHSSLKAIGDVGGGANTVLDALMSYFAPGLLVLPTHTWRTVTSEQHLFDPQLSACCVGRLPELFRHRQGVTRSWHATHSVAAYGADAISYTAGDELCDSPCHRASTWGKLYDRHATILMVGVDLRRCTYLHGVEEWANVPGRLTETVYPYQLRMPDGSLLPIPGRRHVGQPSEQFGLAEPLLREKSALREGLLGDARVLVLDAVRTADTVIAALKQNPGWFDDPAPEGSPV